MNCQILPLGEVRLRRKGGSFDSTHVRTDKDPLDKDPLDKDPPDKDPPTSRNFSATSRRNLSKTDYFTFRKLGQKVTRAVITQSSFFEKFPKTWNQNGTFQSLYMWRLCTVRISEDGYIALEIGPCRSPRPKAVDELRQHDFTKSHVAGPAAIGKALQDRGFACPAGTALGQSHAREMGS